MMGPFIFYLRASITFQKSGPSINSFVGCRCQPWNRPTLVACENGGLEYIPQDLPPLITSLNLRGNKLMQVESGVISNYVKLQYLILSKNRISVLRSKNFDRLNELIDLGVYFSKINLTNSHSYSYNIHL